MKVNMLIIGAGRGGTTTLYEHLKTHPKICFSKIKEIPYFSISDIYKRGDSYYHSFFNYKNQKIIASSDTYLLIDQAAPKRIFDYNPGMKIIVMLREPVERAFSSYAYAINNGHENKRTSFKDAFINESKNISNKDIITKNNLGHFYTGLYYKHINYWMQFIPKENFMLIKTVDLQENHMDVLQKISKFLEIKNFNKRPEIRTNKASAVKMMFLHKFLINRDSYVRKKIARVFPNSFKKLIFNSGIIDKLKGLNQKESIDVKLNPNDRVLVKEYFENDLQLLKDAFGINF